MKVPANRPLADFLPTISIKAKDFAAELTSVNVQAKDLQSETMITQEHIDNNAAVRWILLERGVVPEETLDLSPWVHTIRLVPKDQPDFFPSRVMFQILPDKLKSLNRSKSNS